MQPKLRFFCELSTPGLNLLFKDGEVIQTLKMLNAGLCLSMCDFSAERAKIIEHINNAGIPVTAWLLLPEEHGYQSNLDHVEQTFSRYLEFKTWALENKLSFTSIGLDLRTDISLPRSLKTRRYFQLVPVLMRAFQPWRYARAKRLYQELANLIRADGYLVETLQVPLVIDERFANSTLFQRFLGIVDLSADREILLLQSSNVVTRGLGMLVSYGKDSAAIAIIMTGEGVNSSGGELSWQELELILRYAWCGCNEIYIFNLEGCVQQNYLEQLKTMEWDQPILESGMLAEEVDHRRLSLQFFMWSFARLPVLLFLGFILVLLIQAYKKTNHKSS